MKQGEIPDGQLIRFGEELYGKKRFNAAEEILFSAVERDRENHYAYYLLGQILRDKVNLRASEQMFGIANRLAPANEDYRTSLANIQKMNAAKVQELKQPVKETGAARKFDFLFVPLSRGGSRVLQTYLSLHPDIFVPLRLQLDDALQKREEVEFLLKYQNLIRSLDYARTGIVQHGSLGLQEDSDVPERLAKIVKTDRFIMSVKDPFLAMRSIYNHQIFASTSNYCFSRAGINWFEDGVDLLALIRGDWAPKPQGPLIELPEFGWEFLSQLINAGFHYHKVEMNYRRFFGDCETIDIVELADDIATALPRLYELVGVDKAFTHPKFGINLSGPAHVTMQNNPIHTGVGGQPLRLFLAFEGLSGEFPEYGELTDLAVIEPDERFAEAGLPGHSVCIAAYSEDWCRLDRDVRVKLIGENGFQKLLAETVFPHWLECYKRYRDLYRPHHWARGVPKEYLAPIRDFIGDDAVKFLKDHPRHEDMWPYAGELAGN